MLRIFYSLILSISYKLLFLILLLLFSLDKISQKNFCLFFFTYKERFPLGKIFMHITKKNVFIFYLVLNVQLIVMQNIVSGIFVNHLSYFFFL